MTLRYSTLDGADVPPQDFRCDGPGCHAVPEQAYAVPSVENCEAVLFVCREHQTVKGDWVATFRLLPMASDRLGKLSGGGVVLDMLAQRVLERRWAGVWVEPLRVVNDDDVERVV